MSAEIAAEPAQRLSNARTAAEQSLLARFGEAFENGARQAQAIADPATRQLGAARIALEHAILQTAQEKQMPAPEVAAMLGKASPQQIAHFIREGKKSIERSYGSMQRPWSLRFPPAWSRLIYQKDSLRPRPCGSWSKRVEVWSINRSSVPTRNEASLPTPAEATTSPPSRPPALLSRRTSCATT